MKLMKLIFPVLLMLIAFDIRVDARSHDEDMFQPRTVKPKPVQSAPAKSQPARPQPATPKSVKSAPSKPTPAEPAPPKAKPVKSATAKTAPIEAEAVKPETVALTPTEPASTKSTPTAHAVYVDPSSVGKPWPNAKNKGLLAFRGNPTRTWYGQGPLPDNPRIDWRVGRFCGKSFVGKKGKVWCGTGWTGQPVVWEREDRTEIIFGAYDYNVHFLDSKTGKDIRPAFKTKDIIKGSVSLDADGFPLLYFGSRDNYMRVVSLDGDRPKQLWAINGNMPGRVWNNDWDGNPLILGDYLLTGGENSWFFIAKLNRKMVDGKVQVKPKIVSKIPGFTRDLFRKIGDRSVSIENSVAVFENKVYFANGGGLVQGYDIDKLIAGAKRPQALVFEYWVGDDVDATIVIDELGKLYVAIEKERRGNAGQKRAGQLVKLDPSKPENPIVWHHEFPGKNKGGIWATPALYKDRLYVSTHPGDLVALDRNTGEITWRETIGWHAWSSPVVIDDQLLVGTCTGRLNRYSLANPAQPKRVWSFKIPSGGCVESTPAVWKGRIYVGNRDGFFYAIGDGRGTHHI